MSSPCFLVLALFAVGCGAKVDDAASPRADAGSDVTAPFEAAVDATKPDVSFDTFAAFDAFDAFEELEVSSDVGDRAPWVPLTEAQAECLELMRPVCTACHRRDGVWYLRPRDVPPPPSSHPSSTEFDCGTFAP